MKSASVMFKKAHGKEPEIPFMRKVSGRFGE